MAPPAPFAVSSEDLAGGVCAIAIRGELDLSTAPELERALAAAETSGAPILLDLSSCEFIDSTGIALIVRAWQRCGQSDGGAERLALCCADAQVRRLLEITGLHKSLDLHERREDALSQLVASAG